MERPGTTNVLALFAIILLLDPCRCYFSAADSAASYDVVKLGAKPDGKTESSGAFLKAWSAACASTGPSTVYVPPGKYFLRNVAFRGPCRNNGITFRIEGTLLAPSSYRVNGNSENWVIFRDVIGVSIYGGILDGRGGALWDCKSSGKSCPTGATNLEFSNSKDIFVSGTTSLNSQLFHVVFNGCQNIKVQGARIVASGKSPNTDGIHVQGSTGVTILNSRISTGDDCISVGPGSKNLWIENVACGPGHGISIGSLGKVANEEGVENVTVSAVTFSGTQNGVRIKSWARPSDSFARNIVFRRATMFNVKNPIIIDQHYCPDHEDCPNQASGVTVSDVTYTDIHGASATQVGVKLDCSSKNPCTGIRMENVKITYKNQIASASCSYASGTTTGSVQPSNCF